MKRPGRGGARRRRSASPRPPVALDTRALDAHDSEALRGRPPVTLDVAGRRIDLTAAEAMRLRDAAAVRAGRSSTARDLSLLLDRALHRRHVIALRRSEAHALAQLARHVGLLALVRELEAPAA